jgi:hypothetical protein
MVATPAPLLKAIKLPEVAANFKPEDGKLAVFSAAKPLQFKPSKAVNTCPLTSPLSNVTGAALAIEAKLDNAKAVITFFIFVPITKIWIVSFSSLQTAATIVRLTYISYVCNAQIDEALMTALERWEELGKPA